MQTHFQYKAMLHVHASSHYFHTSIDLTILMPRPPPPYAALKMTGSPYCSQKCLASSILATGPSDPGTTCTPTESENHMSKTRLHACNESMLTISQLHFPSVGKVSQTDQIYEILFIAFYSILSLVLRYNPV